jgi:heavy metal sensor kinase
MRFGQLKFLRRSIRFRLMAWNTGVVLVMALAALFALREGLRLTLMNELDERLREDALEVRLAVEQFYPDFDAIREELNRKAIGHAHQEMFIQLVDQQGKVLVSSVQTPRVNLPRMVGEHPTPIIWHDYRLVQRKFSKAGLPAFAVRVGSSIESIRADVAKLTRLILVVCLALLPLAIFGGYLLTDRALRPVARIIRLARRMRPSKLDERLPIRATGDELDQLSTTINHLLDRIADYLMRHREFIANAAHELRSPLAAIQSSAEVCLTSDRSVEDYKELLYGIVEQCRHLGILVNQLLLLAESDSSQPFAADERVPLDHVVEKSVDMFRAAAEERGIGLEASYLPTLEVPGNTFRIRQVVNNLIDNAIKFTPPGGQVRVDLHKDASEHYALLRVSDTGVGISPVDLPHIFERFYQVDRSRQREKQARGNGLGLAICQAIVSSHGGRIEVRSKLGEGSTFIVMLPLERRSAEAGDELEPLSVNGASAIATSLPHTRSGIT